MATRHTDGTSSDDDRDGWEPAIEGRGRRGCLGRVLLALLVVAVAVVLGVPWLVSQQIPRTPVDGLADGSGPLHVLVAGSDSREGLTPEEQQELSTGSADFFEGERTDTVFVMTIEGGDVALLSFPRDLWVERCDGTTGRINVAQSIGGPGCLVATVRELSGIPISHYLGISFGGFVDMVDAVDGVELCLDEAIADADAGIDLPAGCQVLQGPDALGYVRVRKIDNDLQRIQRQQRFVQALAGELTEPASLLNPPRMWSVGRSVGGAVIADEGLGLFDMARIAYGVRGLASGGTPTSTVPSDPGRTEGGAAVLYVREAEAEALFARFRDGSVLDEGTEATDGSDEPSTPLPEPSEIELVVANGAGVDGLAGRASELLRSRGYQVTGVTNAENREVTVVRHPPGDEAAAQRLLEDLPSTTTIEESSEVAGLTLILGRDAAELA